MDKHDGLISGDNRSICASLSALCRTIWLLIHIEYWRSRARRARGGGDEAGAVICGLVMRALAVTRTTRRGIVWAHVNDHLDGFDGRAADYRRHAAAYGRLARGTQSCSPTRARQTGQRQSHGQRRGHRRRARSTSGAPPGDSEPPRPAKRPARYTYAVLPREARS